MEQDEIIKQSQEVMQNGFSLPALQIANKNYSLQADMVTGWQPHKMKVVGPVPLNFDATICDQIVEKLTTFGSKNTQRVIYLGPRYASSFKMHQQLRRDYSYKYEAIINTNFPHLAAYFRKFYSHFKPKHARPFKGMNPTVKPGQTAIFDGGFESANLDTAIRVGANEYDVFMRVDSNTRGHLQWYNFTVRGAGLRKIKINIVNCRRGRTLYNYSMKPYIWSSYHRGIWKQGCNNVKYQQKQLRYNFLKQMFSEERLVYNCLSFQYTFQDEDQIVQFAYCPPFTYSDNSKMIQGLHNISGGYQTPVLKQQVAGQTLGGLDIPLLTITDTNVPDSFKTCVFVSGRIHPGQTCGSYMVKGFLQFLVSTDVVAVELRKQIVFKVIPMVNPDGVVVGNFRTSLCGRDLNRMFRSEQSLLIPEVSTIKGVVKKLKSEYKNRLQFYFDFHGHSVRKNVFIYGPEYEIWQTNYYRTRILPKLISERTEMFRYYSCMFRISSQKKTTARAVLLKHVPHCYTVQASVGSYYCPSQKKDYQFTPISWQSMGKLVVVGIGDYFKLVDTRRIPKTKEKEKQKDKNERKEGSLPRVRISASKTKRKFSQPPRQDRQQLEDVRKTNMQKLNNIEQQLYDVTSQGCFLDSAKDVIEDIKKAEKELKNNQDKYSQGGSDSEPSDDDLSEKQLKMLHQNIIVSLKEFKDKFYHKGKESKPKPQPLQSSAQMPSKKLEMIASLRKKAEINSQARIESSTQRIPKSSGREKMWMRGTSGRRHPIPQVAESQSFNVYVTKLKVARQQAEQCRISYFSPRKKPSGN